MKCLLIFFLAVSFALATDYHIDSTASQGGDGSLSSPFNELTDINWDTVHNKIISGNDVHIKLKRGSVFDTPEGWAGWRWYAGGTLENRIYLEAYGTGAMPIIQSLPGKRCIFLSGSDKGRNSGYVTFDGIEIRNGFSAIEGSDLTHLVIKNCKIHDMKLSCIQTGSYAVVGGSPDDGNEIYDCGTGTGSCDVRISNAHDIVVSYNRLYATKDYVDDAADARGIDGLLVDSAGSSEQKVYNVLIEHNEIFGHNDGSGACPDEGGDCGGDCHSLCGRGEDGIDLKNVRNITVRYNHIYNHQYQSAITVQMNSRDIYIYGNVLHGSKWANIMMMDGSVNSARRNDGISGQNIHIWGNVIYDSDISGISIANHNNADPIHEVYIYNNVIAFSANDNDANDEAAGIFVGDRNSNIKIKNNIFYKNNPYGTDYKQLHFRSTSGVELAGNHYYWPGQTSRTFWTGTMYDSVNVPGSYGDEGNPDFVDVENFDFRLQAGSDCIGTGVQTDEFHKAIMDPDSEYEKFPPEISLIVQDNTWDKGAYAYNEQTSCITQWSCDDWSSWSECLDGTQQRSRICTDTNGCQDDKEESQTQDCSAEEKQYNAQRIRSQVQIDGEIDEYSAADIITLTSPVGTVGRYSFMWDEQYIYAAGDVTDDSIDAEYTEEDSNLWSDDSIELIFDTDNNGGSKPASDDYKFFVSAIGTQADSRGYDMTWDSEMEAAAVPTPDGYRFEARIPMQVSNGTNWGFNFMMNDKGRTDIIWSGASINTLDDAGEIMFVDDCIDLMGLLDVIDNWKNGHVNIEHLMAKIQLWLNCE